MTSQPGQQTIAIHILSNNSRSKSNQTMKLGQLIEYNKRNIFFEKYPSMLLLNFLRNYLKVIKISHFVKHA